MCAFTFIMNWNHLFISGGLETALLARFVGGTTERRRQPINRIDRSIAAASLRAIRSTVQLASTRAVLRGRAGVGGGGWWTGEIAD